MEITINIKAPELAHALETLAIAIGCTVDKMNVGEPIKDAARQGVREPYSKNRVMPDAPSETVKDAAQQIPIQNPVQQVPVQQPPVQVPTQTNPIQQPPVQQVPVQQPQIQQPVQQVVPTQAQTYTMDQLAIAATQLMDAGKRNELINLLAQFGVQALTALPKEQYGAFATALRGMGAKI